METGRGEGVGGLGRVGRVGDKVGSAGVAGKDVMEKREVMRSGDGGGKKSEAVTEEEGDREVKGKGNCSREFGVEGGAGVSAVFFFLSRTFVLLTAFMA